MEPQMSPYQHPQDKGTLPHVWKKIRRSRIEFSLVVRQKQMKILSKKLLSFQRISAAHNQKLETKRKKYHD